METPAAVNIPSSAARNPGTLEKYRTPILFALVAGLLVSGGIFISGLLKSEKEGKAWAAFLESAQNEEKDFSKIEEIVAGSSAEPWFFLSAASAAIEKEDFTLAQKYLEKFDRLNPALLQGAGALLETNQTPQKLSDQIRTKIAKLLAWKKDHANLFANPEPGPKPRIVFVTDEGSFTLALFDKESPKTCENFIKLCKESAYVGTRVTEVLTGTSIRIGDLSSKSEDPAQWANLGPGYTLKEEKNSLYNYKWAVSAYKAPGDSEFSGSQFVISLKNQLHQEGLVFGQVVGGMDTLERIGAIAAEFKTGKSTPSRLVSIKETRVEE